MSEEETARLEEHLLLCGACRGKVKAADEYVKAMRAAGTRVRREANERAAGKKLARAAKKRRAGTKKRA
jgi:predicted anti-sigma-YlaC factor YlaD